MNDALNIFEKQLKVEIEGAKQKLTSNNLDNIYKLAYVITNIKRMNVDTQSKSEKPVYSNDIFEKNIDLLYGKYMDAKQMYREMGGQENKNALLESVRRLMSEVYDMIGSMIRDCECADEKREIQLSVKKLHEM